MSNPATLIKVMASIITLKVAKEFTITMANFNFDLTALLQRL